MKLILYCIAILLGASGIVSASPMPQGEMQSRTDGFWVYDKWCRTYAGAACWLPLDGVVGGDDPTLLDYSADRTIATIYTCDGGCIPTNYYGPNNPAASTCDNAVFYADYPQVYDSNGNLDYACSWLEGGDLC